MPSKPARWPDLRHVLLLTIIIALSFSPCLFNNFVNWDDDTHILENPQVVSSGLQNLQDIFQSTVNKTYIPLTILTFNIEHRMSGLHPFIVHLDNIILHILVCLLIYRLVVRMGFHKNIGFLTALLFGVHPMHVEAVAWATARKDLLYSVFYLLAIDQYWSYLHRRGTACYAPTTVRHYFVSLIFGLLSILAKPMALSLPLVLGLLDWYKHKSFTRHSFIQLLPFFAVTAPIAWITYQLNSRIPAVDGGHSLLLWAWSATFYIKKFLTPFTLIPLYQVPQPISLLNPSYWSALLVLITVPASMIIWRKNRLWIFACLFYIFSTFFLWRFDIAVDVTMVGDRYMYLPSLGFCLFFADALIKQPKLKWLAAGIIIFFVLKTAAQCRIWRDDLTLWNYVIGQRQEVFLAYNSRAVARSKVDDKTGALEDFNKALTLNPNYARGYFNRGKLLADMGHRQQSLEDFNKAVAMAPDNSKYVTERGIAYSKANELEQALEDFNTAIRLQPNDAGAYNNRGLTYKKMGEPSAALNDFTQALRLDPRLTYAYVNRADVRKDLKDYKNALEDFQKAQVLGFPMEDKRIMELQKLLKENATSD